jgi:hypothetical protein
MATESDKKQKPKSTPDPKSETKKELTKEQKDRAARFVANGSENW